MKMWVLGGVFWAAVVGGVLAFAPKKKPAPPATPAPAAAVAVADPVPPPPADAVVNVLDLSPLLDPPAESDDAPVAADAARPALPTFVQAGGEIRTGEQAVRHAVGTGEPAAPPIPPAGD